MYVNYISIKLGWGDETIYCKKAPQPLDIYSRKQKTYFNKKITRKFMIALFIITPNWKQPRVRVDKLWYIHLCFLQFSVCYTSQ